MNKDKSYLQMLRELTGKAQITITEEQGDYYVEYQVSGEYKAHYADTLEHAIEKAWIALCSQ